MNVLIKLNYIGWESNIERKGYFLINHKKFKENNDMAVAEVACQWIREIRRTENIGQIICSKSVSIISFQGYADNNIK